MSFIVLLSAAAIGMALLRGDGAPAGHADAGTARPSSDDASEEAPAEWSLGHGYARRGDHIVFDGVRIDQSGRETLEAFERVLGRTVVLAHDVDAASFAALSAEYAKDRRTVYYRWTSPGRFWVVEIPGADPATFEVMDFDLAKDANRVWRTDVPIEGADAATAQVVNPGWVWKDRRTVYYQFTPLDGADPATFRHLNQAFYRDARNVYWSTTRLEGADANTFRTFGNDVPYAADERHVWFGDRRIPHVDAASFRLLHNHVFADSEGVFVSGRGLSVVEGDAATFRKVAELESAGCVLFRDAARRYVFEPAYAEMYTLTPTPDAVVVTKPVWFGDPDGSVRLAATVSATWRDDALSQPVVEMQPGFVGAPVPTWEVGKLQRLTDAIREALAVPVTQPVGMAAGGERLMAMRTVDGATRE